MGAVCGDAAPAMPAAIAASAPARDSAGDAGRQETPRKLPTAGSVGGGCFIGKMRHVLGPGMLGGSPRIRWLGPPSGANAPPRSLGLRDFLDGDAMVVRAARGTNDTAGHLRATTWGRRSSGIAWSRSSAAPEGAEGPQTGQPPSLCAGRLRVAPSDRHQWRSGLRRSCRPRRNRTDDREGQSPCTVEFPESPVSAIQQCRREDRRVI